MVTPNVCRNSKSLTFTFYLFYFPCSKGDYVSEAILLNSTDFLGAVVVKYAEM